MANDVGTRQDVKIQMDLSEDGTPTEDTPVNSDTPRDLSIGEELIPVVVAFGWQGLTSVSIDEGQTWCQTGFMSDPHDEVQRFTDGCKHIRSLAFGNGRFVAGLDDLGWWESTDGQTWAQLDAKAGSVAVWNGSDFEGQVNGNTIWRGRGLCMWGEGWETNAKIMRSENEDCSNPTQVASPAHSVTTIAFGEVPAEEYQPGKLPDALRTCLGL